MPERYHTLAAADDGLITEIRIEDAK